MLMRLYLQKRGRLDFWILKSQKINNFWGALTNRGSSSAKKFKTTHSLIKCQNV